MFVFYDRQGNVKEIINDEVARVGNSNINVIYAYFEELGNDEIANIVVDATYRLANSNIHIQDTPADSVVAQIPYDKKRDLKFFKYWQDYRFYKIVVDDEVLAQTGVVGCEITYTLPTSIKKCGVITFNVTGLHDIAVDEYINLSQYNYLQKLIADKIAEKSKVYRHNVKLHFTETDQVRKPGEIRVVLYTTDITPIEDTQTLCQEIGDGNAIVCSYRYQTEFGYSAYTSAIIGVYDLHDIDHTMSLEVDCGYNTYIGDVDLIYEDFIDSVVDVVKEV